MNQMTNEQTDTALILENELKRRVKEVVSGMVGMEVDAAMQRRFVAEKEKMMMEISITIGQMLQTIEKEGRQPLWVTGPEAMKQVSGGKDALREQTPSLQEGISTAA